MRTTAEITLDSPLGQMLKELASQSTTIVEIGTGSGLGSTKCILAGLGNKRHHFTTIEGNWEQYTLAKQNLARDPVAVLWGTLHRTIRPFFHPEEVPAHREMWTMENETVREAQLVDLSLLPKTIDLLFLDGGEFTSDGDFLVLWQRSKTIVIDDCYSGLATKNVYAFSCMADCADFETARVDLGDRNGWAVFRRN